MTITESKPLDRGKPEIRLIEIEENGVEASTVRGVKLETVEWVLTLADWHAVQPVTNFLKNVGIPGHQ